MIRTAIRHRLIAAIAAALLCLGMACLVAGCSSSGGSSAASSSASASSSAASSATRTFTDSVGREVELPAEITAITPSGFTAQMVLLTIAPEKMVSLASEIPEANQKFFDVDADNLPITGAMFGKADTFNVEEVANSGTQVIIDTGEAKKGIAEDLDAMQEKIGIPCVFIETTLDKYDEAYNMLGELLGKEDRGAELAKYCADAYKTTTDAMAGIPQDQWVRMAYLTGEDGLNAIAKDSYQGGVIDLCADNVYVNDTANGSGQGQEISMEQLTSWDPSVIVFSPGGLNAENSAYNHVADDPAWQGLTAIKDGTYYEVPITPWNWLNNPPTVNQVMGVQWLPRLLYPDAFDDSIRDVAKAYYKTMLNYDLSDDEFQQIAGNALVK